MLQSSRLLALGLCENMPGELRWLQSSFPTMIYKAYRLIALQLEVELKVPDVKFGEKLFVALLNMAAFPEWLALLTDFDARTVGMFVVQLPWTYLIRAVRQ